MPREKSVRRLPAADAASAIDALPPLNGLDDGQPQSPPAPVAHSHVFFWITQIMGRRDRLLAREFRPLGVRVPEWRVVLAVQVRPGITMTEVAEYATIDPTTLSRSMEQMIRAGWIERTADHQDMRIMRLSLSKKGRELFDKLWPIADRVNRIACQDLPEGAAQLMCLGLGTIHRGLARATDLSEVDEEAGALLVVE
ncbi:MarR family transcriptional regulator [Bradyrhizobium sp. CER78]|nr:MarR family transcriptional regulator [Bradyrhizobium sp. CER78]MDH2380746.1 MarR family transcriptional regulator [Bradyrhizobium sp. CER78]